MTLTLFPNAQRYNTPRWANLFSQRLDGFIERLHLSKVPQLPAPATSHKITNARIAQHPISLNDSTEALSNGLSNFSRKSYPGTLHLTSYDRKTFRDDCSSIPSPSGRLTIPCSCGGDMEPINFHESLPVIRFSCRSCHLNSLVQVDELRSVSGWGMAVS